MTSLAVCKTHLYNNINHSPHAIDEIIYTNGKFGLSNTGLRDKSCAKFYINLWRLFCHYTCKPDFLVETKSDR